VIASQMRGNEQLSRVYDSDEELLQLMCGGEINAAGEGAGAVAGRESRPSRRREQGQGECG
jgi:hypothetical protein